jgi:hypothetical protein
LLKPAIRPGLLIFVGYKYKTIFESPELSVESMQVKLAEAENALKASKGLRFRTVLNNKKGDEKPEDDSDDESDEGFDEDDSDDECDEGFDEGGVEDFEDVLEGIKTYARGLLDLTLSIESPAKDSPHRGLEALTDPTSVFFNAFGRGCVQHRSLLPLSMADPDQIQDWTRMRSNKLAHPEAGGCRDDLKLIGPPEIATLDTGLSPSKPHPGIL